MYPNRHLQLQQQNRVKSHIENTDTNAFFELLSEPELLAKLETLVPPHRERLFPPKETLAMFIGQVMNADRSCQNAVNQTAIQRLSAGLPDCSSHTGAYCKARQRLPLEMISTLSCCAGNKISSSSPEGWRWQGREVRLVDGTAISMPDTVENQAVFPQSASQAPGLGFPQCRMVGIVCLASGAVLDAALGPCKGKGSDEQSLLRSLLPTLKPGNLLLGDAFYATYFLLCALQAQGVDGVFEQHGARRTDFRRGQSLGTRDHLIKLKKPEKKPDWMSQEDFDQAPKCLTVRELRAGGKVLVTTLLCPKETRKNALKKLYKSRWHVELDLRNIKTTLGMDILSCHTPEMVKKEIWTYLLAYNLVRLIMAQAALQAGVVPRQLSFKHTLQLWIAWVNYIPEQCSEEKKETFFILVAQQRVGKRNGRIEPRAVKRRPKPFPLLTKPRKEAREQVKKHGHPKKS
jgi:hypothetical protein